LLLLLEWGLREGASTAAAAAQRRREQVLVGLKFLINIFLYFKNFIFKFIYFILH
jgi:hypothetical protein